ncbi:MAG: TonB-dependent receptor [Myxococcota bacterium]|nr:TonB-dependent receptor [Myxococcota bacterium]
MRLSTFLVLLLLLAPSAQAGQAPSEASEGQPQDEAEDEDNKDEEEEEEEEEDEEEDEDLPTIEEAVVITATGEPRLLSDSPIPVRLVDEETIRRSSAADAGELLRKVPGVPVMSSGSERRGGGSGVSLQGIPAGRTAILLDGRPIVGDVGGLVDLSQFPASMLERVEIVEGPMSALYGSDALGGVVNLITRRPDPGASLNARLQVASDRGLDLSLTQSGALDDGFSWGATGNLSHSAAISLDKDEPATDLDARTAAGIRFFAALRRSKNRLEFSGLYHHDARKGTLVRTNQAIDHQAIYDSPKRHDRFSASLSWRHRFSDALQARWELDLADYSFLLDEDLQSSPVFSRRAARAGRISGRFRLDIAAVPWATALAGVEGGRESLSIVQDRQLAGQEPEQVIEVAPTDEWSLEPWIQGDIRLFEGRLEFVPGLRLSIHEAYGFAAAPSLAIRVKLWPDGTLRISGGRGYRAPSLKDRYLVFDHAALGYIVYGDPDLQPESSWGVNLSVEQRFGETANLRIGGFAHRLSDLITFVYDGASSGDGLNIYRSTNVEGARSVGGQASLDLQWKVLRATLAYRFVWAWSDSGFFLPDTPIHGLRATVQARIPKADLLLYTAVGWESDRYVDAGQGLRSPGTVLWDLRLEKEFGKQRDLALYVEVENLLDQHRDPNREADLRPVRGRRVLGGIRGTLRFDQERVEK